MTATKYKQNSRITQSVVRRFIRYNHLTGEMAWKHRDRSEFELSSAWKTWNKRFEGVRCGHLNINGYYEIAIYGDSFLGHRLAWLHYYGRYPETGLDHINGNESDNSIDNLRECTQAENSSNAKLSRGNTSGVVGVSWSGQNKNWRADITKNNIHYCLGHFAKFSDAVFARKKAEIKFNFHKNHGRK